MSKAVSQFQRARVDLAAFIPLVCQDDHGTPLSLAPVHNAWLAHVDYCWRRKLKALILAPFGHGKSSSLLVPLAAYCIGRDPNTRIKVVTNDDDSASKRVATVGKILETPAYRSVFPGVRPGNRWTGHEVYVERTGQAIDPTIQARGIFTTGIGGRADVELFDDIVDQKNAANAIQRSRVMDLAEQTWLSRLEPDGNVLAIGTAWHCLPAGGIVLTPAGRMPASQLATNTVVEVSPGVYEPLRKLKSQPYHGELVEIRSAWCCEPIAVTPTHRIPTVDGDKEAGSITLDDWVELALPPVSPLVDLQNIGPADEELSQLCDAKAASKIKPYVPLKFTVEQFQKLRERGLSSRKISAELGISIRQVSYVANRLGMGGRRKGLGKLLVDANRKEFWRFVGLWLAEGTAVDNDREIAFHLGNSSSEEQLADFALSEIQAMGLAGRKFLRDGSWRVHTYSASLGRWLVKNFGKRASGKRLPVWWARLPRECLMAAFGGWVDGDGRDEGGTLRAWTVSRDLAFDWQRCLWAHGLRASTYRRKQKIGHIGKRTFRTVQPYAYQLYCSGRSEGQRWAHRNVRYDGGRTWLRVTKIERVPYDGLVYDLQTSTGYFTGSCHRIHNSGDAYHHWMQQPGWCTLVQSVADDCLSIEQVVYGAGDDYPGLAP